MFKVLRLLTSIDSLPPVAATAANVLPELRSTLPQNTGASTIPSKTMCPNQSLLSEQMFSAGPIHPVFMIPQPISSVPEVSQNPAPPAPSKLLEAAVSLMTGGHGNTPVMPSPDNSKDDVPAAERASEMPKRKCSTQDSDAAGNAKRRTMTNATQSEALHAKGSQHSHYPKGSNIAGRCIRPWHTPSQTSWSAAAPGHYQLKRTQTRNG